MARTHEELAALIHRRRQTGKVWQLAFYGATGIAILSLIVLLLNIFNGAFGFVLIQNEVEPADLVASGNLADLDQAGLIAIIEEYQSAGLVRRFNAEKPLANRSERELIDLVEERVVKPVIIQAWSLQDSIFRQNEIRAVAADSDLTTLTFRSWVSWEFVVSPQNPSPQFAGVRTALLGSLWMILIVMVVAFPMGVAAAIYLEEYATKKTWYNRLIEVNIYNLAGIPSIIYGLLGLALFVRGMAPFTSGAMFDPTVDETTNGRTIISAGLTLALLILPLIIINSREALKAIPKSLRESSYAVGATKWQTVWHHVLPASFERVLTGTILAISRAVGETAPLVVVGASTFVTFDPASLFAKFTTMPIQIYQWSARPQSQFRNIAAGAIIVLLILMLSMNAFAIIMRNRIAKERRV
ncbi:MAG: phosphate ABC transporter permease PstA [Spirochaetales bacterium]|nr:phosphate ABC transporter permease PstA [Spirochaetales bacterium]